MPDTYELTLRFNSAEDLFNAAEALKSAQTKCAGALDPGLPVQQTPVTPVSVDVPSAAQPTPAPSVQGSPLPAAPVSPVPTYTLGQLQVAVAPLIDAGKGPELKALLEKYQVKRLPELPQEKMGAFATDLRAMGAQI